MPVSTYSETNFWRRSVREVDVMVEAYQSDLLVRPHWVYLRMPMANGKALRFVAVVVGSPSSRTE